MEVDAWPVFYEYLKLDACPVPYFRPKCPAMLWLNQREMMDANSDDGTLDKLAYAYSQKTALLFHAFTV